MKQKAFHTIDDISAAATIEQYTFFYTGAKSSSFRELAEEAIPVAGIDKHFDASNDRPHLLKKRKQKPAVQRESTFAKRLNSRNGSKTLSRGKA